MEFLSHFMLFFRVFCVVRGRWEKSFVGQPKFHAISNALASVISIDNLILAHHCAILISEDSQWRITQNLPPRMHRVNTLRLRLLLKKFCLYRTRLSRLNSMPRSECGNSARYGLPATFLPVGIRRPFLPPCQSPPRRLTAFPQHAITLA